MIITCHKCKTSFVTKETLIGSSGRYVRCSKCNNVWFATIALKPSNSTSLIIDENLKIQLPAIVKQPAKLWQIILLFLLVIILSQLIANIFENNQHITNFKNSTCKIFNICSLDHLKLESSKINYNIEAKTIDIEYKIINNSPHLVKLPMVRISLIDKNFNIIKADKLKHKNIILQPFGQQTIKTIVTDTPASAYEINIEIGNWFDFVIN